MSKVVVSLPKGAAARSMTGALAAPGSYVGLQFLWALLIHREILDPARLYPMVCLSAAAASFVGCVYCVVSGRESRVLTVPAVVAVFLTVTVTAALLTTETVAVSNGLTGVGLSMAAGGLAASLVGGKRKGQGRRRRRKKRT